MNKFGIILKKIMNKINFSSEKYWELRYLSNGNSGVGSYGEKCEVKAQKLNDLISEFNIQTVLEYGCGDGNQLKYYKIPQYMGLDVSMTTVLRCIEIFKSDSSKSFMHYTPKAYHNNGGVFVADATLSVEVIFHLVEDEVFEKYMDDLFNTAKKYVLIFSSNHNNNEGSNIHLKHRKFTDYSDKKFPNWKLIRQEGVFTKTEGHFNDFFVFQKMS